MFASDKGNSILKKGNPMSNQILFIMREKNINEAQVYGYVNGVRIKELENGKSIVNVQIRSAQSYPLKENGEIKTNEKGKTEFGQRSDFHKVVFVTGDDALLDTMREIRTDLEAKAAGEKEVKNHTMFATGVLVAKDDAHIAAKEDSVSFDKELEQGLSRNSINLVGNISNINIYEEQGFATASIATHFFAPSGGDKKYEEKTSYIPVVFNAKALPDSWKAIKNGDIAVGDLVTVKGMMRNNNYTDTKENKKYEMRVDANTFKILERSKKNAANQAEAQKAEVKQAEAPKAESKKAESKKAATKKTKGVTM